jgi:uncharacterized NAD(P)/FAD-binding protein YdhS
METPTKPNRIAIIGGGVSGSLLAIQLLRSSQSPLQVLVLERTGELGRGVAYGTRCVEHVLNVPAIRMGAFPEAPGHFYQWLAARAGQPGFPARVAPEDFVPRHLFGEYVQSLLDEARANAPAGVTFEVLPREAIDIEEEPERLRVHCGDGSTVEADRVVLAVGNLPGEYPIPKPLPVYQTPRYVHIPWRPDVLEGIGPDDAVLLVGQGLTATDLMVQLAHRRHRGTIHAVSRYGIRPQIHQPSGAPWQLPDVRSVPPTIRAWTRYVREAIASASHHDIGWREVIDGVRPHAQAIWRSFSWEERARFLRHVRPFWDAHRHRIAPQTAAMVEQLAADGRLQFHAGRLQVIEANDHGVQVLLRRRGSIQHVALQVAKVINCTSARTDYTKYQHPLFIHLLARGLIDHDPLALGINAVPTTGEVIRYRGEPLGRIFTLGAPLKGVLWESTAVREIREQAVALAETLLASDHSHISR